MLISLYMFITLIFSLKISKKKPDFNSAQPGPEKKNFHDEKKFLKTFPKGVTIKKILPVFIEKIRVINIY